MSRNAANPATNRRDPRAAWARLPAIARHSDSIAAIDRMHRALARHEMLVTSGATTDELDAVAIDLGQAHASLETEELIRRHRAECERPVRIADQLRIAAVGLTGTERADLLRRAEAAGDDAEPCGGCWPCTAAETLARARQPIARPDALRRGLNVLSRRNSR